MKNLLICLAALTIPFIVFPQVTIYGKISDTEGKPVPLANIYIKDIYDGAITNEEGKFSFQTLFKDTMVLIASAVGLKRFEKIILLAKDSFYIEIVLEPQAVKLDDIIISAGVFEASDKKRGVQLRPLDIVTTAGGGGDIYGALQTLPGVSPANSESGLFVRGGSAHETKTIIDGMVVANPFFGDVPDIPARARFSPFGFSGVVFSAGGYSAEYGQALSSVLILTSTSDIDDNAKSIGVNAAGASFSWLQTLRNKKTIYAEAGFTNLKPLFSIVTQNREWQTPPKGYSATIAYLSKNNMSNFRVQARFQANKLALYFPNGGDNRSYFQNQTSNFSAYSSFTQQLRKNWNLFAGVAFQHDCQNKTLDLNTLPQRETFLQLRSTISKRLHRVISFKTGLEMQINSYQTAFNQLQNSFAQLYTAAFIETENRLSGRLMAKTGVRFDGSNSIGQGKISPRLAMVYKTGHNSQVSLAYGHFYQNPEKEAYARNNNLDCEKAIHYLINYQFLTNAYTFRIEGFFKTYENLVTYTGMNGNLSNIKNGGNGFAKGIDVFWRDNNGSLKKFDYWISYSFIRSERLFRNIGFPITPSFAPVHTLNIVTKYDLAKIRSRLGMTYTVSSGKTFYNPVNNTRIDAINFQNFSLSGSHITSIFNQFAVVYISVNNVFNRKNVLNYRFSEDGTMVQEVVPSAYRSYFAGITVRF